MVDGPLESVRARRYHELIARLGRHPLYGAIHSRDALRVFMEHHVYAVWDFMSLVKAFQAQVAPSVVPWVPPRNARLAAFTTQLVLEEESDPELGYVSHFEVYCRAMAEVGADVAPIARFIARVQNDGLEAALSDPAIPEPARRFMRFTFEVIGRNRLQEVAAVLAYGREMVIPDVFRSLLDQPDTGPESSPTLHRYLKRHVQLDGDEHGPLSARLVEELCEGNAAKYAEAIDAATRAITARLDLWDGIYQALSGARA